MKKSGLYILMATMLSLFCVACKKEKEKAAVQGDDLTVAVIKGLSAYKQIPTSETDTAIGNLGIVYPAKLKAKIVALLKQAATTDVEVTAKIGTNPRLIKIFDSLYQSSSPVVPEGLFKVAGNGEVTVKAGELQSVDSIEIELDNVALLPKNNSIQEKTLTYVVPIVLQTKSAGAELKSNYMFIRYTVIIRRLIASVTYNFENSQFLGLFRDDKGSFVIGGLLSSQIKSPVTIGVDINKDKAFIDAFNEKNGTDYEPFPEGSYELIFKEPAITIPAYKTRSTEHIQIKLTNASLLDPYKDYMMQLKVKNDQAVEPNKDAVYVTKTKEKLDSTNTLDRTGWTLTAGSSFSYNPPGQALDGKFDTQWLSGNVKTLTIDMGTTQTVKGFFIASGQSQSQLFDFVNTEVFSSNDGQTWNLELNYKGLATPPRSSGTRLDIKTLKFSNAVKARYFKFNVLKTSSGNDRTGMAEIYAMK